MSKQTTSIRLDPTLRREVLREAKRAGLSFTGVVHLLLRAFTDGTVHVGVIQYPKGYLESLGKEADNLRRQHRAGKVKTYRSSKALFDDILKR